MAPRVIPSTDLRGHTMLRLLFLAATLSGALGLDLVAVRCDEDAVYPHPKSSRLYSKCEKGRLTTKFCGIDERFESGSCVHSSDVGCKEGDSRPSASCVSYMVCKDGKWIESYCPLYNTYDPKESRCVSFTKYTCTLSPKEINSCVEGEVESINCRRYRSCDKGEWLVKACALGEVFDENSLSCKMGKCGQRSKREVGTCEEGHKRRVEETCNKYTECIDGEEVPKTCPDCQNFDDDTRTCKIILFKACPSPAPPVPTDPTTEPSPDTSAPTEPSPDTSAPTEPSPDTSAPTEPSPDTSEPTEPSPDTSAPTEPSPETSEPTEPSPETSEPTEPSPETSEPTEPSPETSEPTEPSPETSEPTEPSPETSEPTKPSPETSEPTEPSHETSEPTKPSPETSEPTEPSPETSEPTEPSPETTEPTKPTPKPTPEPTPCKEGEKKPVSGDCSKYKECVGGIFKDDSCFWPRNFDSVSNECVWYGATCA